MRRCWQGEEDVETRRKRLAASVETAVDVMDMADEDVHALRYVPLSFRQTLTSCMMLYDVIPQPFTTRLRT